jgi:hypothetical protein
VYGGVVVVVWLRKQDRSMCDRVVVILVDGRYSESWLVISFQFSRELMSILAEFLTYQISSFTMESSSTSSPISSYIFF